MNKVIVFLMLAAILILAVLNDHTNSDGDKLRLEGIGSVVSAQLIPAHGGAGAASVMLYTGNKKDKELLAKLLSWLQTAQVVGDARDQFISLGGNPTSMGIGFQSGHSVTIIDAIGSVSRKLDNGSIEVHSDSIPGQVTIYEGQGHTGRRIVAPQLKAWITGGWQGEESFTFTPEEAIAKVLKEHPEFPANAGGVKQVDEDIGGIQGHKQPVTLTTMAQNDGLLEYIVTLTKDYHLQVGDAEAVIVWKYHVDPNNTILLDKQDNMPSIK